MNVKSMLVGLLIAVVASTGTYFLLPPPSGAEASRCVTSSEFNTESISLMKHLDNSILSGACEIMNSPKLYEKKLGDARVIKNPFTDDTSKN